MAAQISARRQSQIIGSILGTAVGDAIGLPYEGLSPRRAAKLWGLPNRHRFFFVFGMISDDTEHTCMVAQSLIASGGNLSKFQEQLAWRFRFWLLSLPAGIGFATLRAILRLWLGFSPARSGIFSAGNGPAMRAAILGVAIRDSKRLQEFVRVSSRITHTNPKAEYGAFAIALAAQIACETEDVSGDEFLLKLQSCLPTEAAELISLIGDAVDSVKIGESTPEFAAKMGLTNGVSGYIYHTVPVAIHGWLSHQNDFAAAITNIIECGGDTDSTAAIVGSIVGAAIGKEGIPTEWLRRMLEWSRSVVWMERLGIELNSTIQAGIPGKPIKLSIISTLSRNIFFLSIVLCHGFRRLLPPY
ncbi:MAG TPA: dinitrogenase reductase [Cyanobacteria bacterium UBA11149]|nr:dinitrogenase reductase [Cyanobacteria bacterium UBA11367]HBE60398.1 dinitrogenase reductase [Cyanobacteria bacterium UBA11366]HBK66327.1 dinitrogenase reductase [Cyanobacteria bacterium UBA11166]HBR73792.1 dinitrogenase reductase [Cyanobacteria bacterium UBA11159]HBS71365.1 dinitrogenase reductase [Cyanobacteria bacterium UBA11153]HBW89967.1 dinitrogenase reductase [Cyanobacteria bacterium UBA11149]HCA95964.1 dinitrogenase reductase [Cyanobacteria bacterium UBA9226]